MEQLFSLDFGSGRPVLVLHGGKLDHRHMVDAIEPVFSGWDGWQRVYLDLPGCGASQGFDDVATQDDVLGHVLTFTRALVEDKPVAVIGESRGSYIAQGLAHAAPELIAGLCLIVPGGFPTDPPPPKPDARAILSRPGLLDTLPDAIRGRAERLVVQTPGLIDKIRDLKLPAAALYDATLEARLQENFLLSFHEEMLASRFEKPSLILSGRQDSISGYVDTMAMLECYPRASYALLDTAGHSLSWERPNVFRELVQDWLTRMAEG